TAEYAALGADVDRGRRAVAGIEQQAGAFVGKQRAVDVRGPAAVEIEPQRPGVGVGRDQERARIEDESVGPGDARGIERVASFGDDAVRDRDLCDGHGVPPEKSISTKSLSP